MQESLLATTFTSGFPDAARKTSFAVPETKRQVLTLARVVLDETFRALDFSVSSALPFLFLSRHVEVQSSLTGLILWWTRESPFAEMTGVKCHSMK